MEFRLSKGNFIGISRQDALSLIERFFGPDYLDIEPISFKNGKVFYLAPLGEKNIFSVKKEDNFIIVASEYSDENYAIDLAKAYAYLNAYVGKFKLNTFTSYNNLVDIQEKLDLIYNKKTLENDFFKKSALFFGNCLAFCINKDLIAGGLKLYLERCKNNNLLNLVNKKILLNLLFLISSDDLLLIRLKNLINSNDVNDPIANSSNVMLMEELFKKEFNQNYNRRFFLGLEKVKNLTREEYFYFLSNHSDTLDRNLSSFASFYFSIGFLIDKELIEVHPEFIKFYQGDDFSFMLAFSKSGLLYDLDSLLSVYDACNYERFVLVMIFALSYYKDQSNKALACYKNLLNKATRLNFSQSINTLLSGEGITITTLSSLNESEFYLLHFYLKEFYPNFYIDALVKVIKKSVKKVNALEITARLVHILFKEDRLRYELVYKEDMNLQNYVNGFDNLKIYMYVSDAIKKNNLETKKIFLLGGKD